MFVLLFLYMRLAVFSRILLLTTFSFIAFYLPKAQTPTDWYLSKIVDDNSGLPQNSIRSMYYDTTTDFLWLATEAGLARYDGQKTKVFDKRQLPFLQSMRILNLVPTVSGEVIGYNGKGDFFTIRHNDVEPGATTLTYEPEEITFRKGNFRNSRNGENERAALQHHSSTVIDRSTALWINNSTWITSLDSTTCLVRNSKIVHSWPRKKGEELSYINCNGTIYAINSNGEGYCIDITTYKRTLLVVQSKVFTAGNARFFYNKLNDQPLLLQGNEVHKIIFTNNVISTQLVATLPTLPTYITAIVLDKNSRHLFVATNATGVYIYHLSPFRVYTAKGDDIFNNNYAFVLADSTHIFTSRSLLFDVNSGSSKPLPMAISWLTGMAVDTAGNIWSATHQSIMHFPIKRPASLQAEPMPGGGFFQTAYLAKNKRLWFSTSTCFGRINGTKVQSLIPYKDELNSLYYLTETPAGALLGVNKKGMYWVDTVYKKIVPELQDAQLTQIRTIYVDSDYRCWISTYGDGIFLYHLQTKKLIRLPVDDRGYLQYGHVFVEDSYGNFLVPTNKGLFRLRKSNLLQIAANATTPLYYQYFDVSDGLLTNEFNGGCQPAYNRLPGGDIVLPAIRGLVRVKMTELPNPTANFLFIDGIETDSGVHKAAGPLRFKSGERRQTWHLSFAQWEQPNNQGLFYRLDADSNWQRLPTGQRDISVSGISGGHHSLQIRHQYGLQPAQAITISTPFYIEKYYYETGWFWFSLGILLAAGVYIIIRIRIRQLENKNVQLQRIIQQNTAALSDKNSQLEETLLDLREALKGLRENSVFKDRLIGLIGHDMLLPLRFVARIANHLYEEAATLSPQLAKENSSEIKNTVTELLYLGESLVQWIKLQEGRFTLIEKPIELRQTVMEIIQVHLPMAAVKNNQLVCAVPAGTFCHYDAVLLKVLLHNLLLNANKFTSGGSITVNGFIRNKEINVEVLDTGTGMNSDMVASLNNGVSVPSQLGTNKEAGWGMGYLLIIDLLRFAHGNMLVKSELNKGTSVQFILPLTMDESLTG